MKRILTILTIAVAVTLTAAAKGRQLLILHTNDTHSCVLPLNPNLADTMLAGRGGFLRRAAMIDQMRKTLFSGTFSSDTEPGVRTLTASFLTNVDVNMKNVSKRTITSLIGVISIQIAFFLIFTLPIVIKF